MLFSSHPVSHLTPSPGLQLFSVFISLHFWCHKKGIKKKSFNILLYLFSTMYLIFITVLHWIRFFFFYYSYCWEFLFHSMAVPQDLVLSFLLFPPPTTPTPILSICQLKDIWAVSHFCIYKWNHHKHLHIGFHMNMSWFLLCKYLGMRLLTHGVSAFLTLSETNKQFSEVTVSYRIPTNNVSNFQVIYILIGTWYCQVFLE